MLITENDKIGRFYEALINRDESYIGIFYVGVKTTSVFCIATCRARKPKKENVEFYTSFKDALDNGYRPCKICKPAENAHQAPDQVQAAIELVKSNTKEKIKDYQLKQMGIGPEVVRRWFNKNYGMTFQAFQRMYRINTAFQELKTGSKTIESAFDAGYESLSGFGYTFKKLIGKLPSLSGGDEIILISRFTTPLGPMFVCATENGVCLLEFTDRRMLETEFKDLQRLLKANIIAGENTHIAKTKKEISEYFEGTRMSFTVPICSPGTIFQQRVWDHLQHIHYGQITTYQQQAMELEMRTAIRAIASANGANRIAIMVPCHRVIGKNGRLAGYGGGLERKRWLLDHENRIVSENN